MMCDHVYQRDLSVNKLLVATSTIGEAEEHIRHEGGEQRSLHIHALDVHVDQVKATRSHLRLNERSLRSGLERYPREQQGQVSMHCRYGVISFGACTFRMPQAA